MLKKHIFPYFFDLYQENKERLGVIRTFIIQMHGITDRSSLFTSISSEKPPIFLLTKRQQIKD